MVNTINKRFYLIPRRNDWWGFVRHAMKKSANVILREEYFDLSKSKTKQIYHNVPAGSQILSFTATRPIKIGEEILIDFGKNYDYEKHGVKKETE